jgi:hypothetical protein
MPGLSTPSKEPTELIGWKRWDSPRRNLIPDPARGDYHSRSQTPLQRPYLGRQRSTHKYTQVSITAFCFFSLHTGVRTSVLDPYSLNPDPDPGNLLNTRIRIQPVAEYGSIPDPDMDPVPDKDLF